MAKIIHIFFTLCTNIVEYIDKKSNTANIRALSEAIKNKQKVKLRLGYCGLADDIEILDSPELEAYVQDYAREHIVR